MQWEGGAPDDSWNIAQLNDGMRHRFNAEHGDACAASRAARASGAASFVPVGGFSEQDVAAFIAEIKKGWQRDAIKYDVRHWLGNVFLIVANKHSVLFPIFANAMADAVFKIISGEYERVRTHLKKLGMSDDDIRRLRRKYWRRRAMYHVPDPARLIRDLVDVYNTFCDLDDPSRPGSKFFNASARADFLKELAYVGKGLLSDKPGMRMYVKIGTVKATGFVLHRCRRSTSQLEGYHLHVRQARRVGAIASAPRLKHVTSNLFDFRWSYRAAVAAGLLPEYGGVGVLQYNDQLYDIASTLGMPGVAALPELDGWVRTRKRSPVLQHGVISLGDATLPPPSDPREKGEAWLRKRNGVDVAAPSALRRPEEVRLVLAHPTAARDGDAVAMARNGVRAKPKRLIDLHTRVVQAEAAFAALDARGWDETRARVRTAVPASGETTAAEFPPLPTVAGAAAFTALPVPPELAGNGGKDADGDVAMEQLAADDASDQEDAPAADEEETSEDRRRRLERERRRRRRAEQSALADAAAAKEQNGEDLDEDERAALAARREETARGKRRRREQQE